MSTIPTPGTTPKKRFQVFKFGVNETDKYGDVLFDHADAIMVMQNHRRRGRLLAIDVEHATQLPQGKPANWQESHGWVDLEVDAAGINAIADYNANGVEKLTSRKFPFDSPAITPWRGNHVCAIEMMSLVKDPARNGSIPLCMSNASPAASAQPTAKVKILQRYHAAMGELVAAAQGAQGEAELRELNEQVADMLTRAPAEGKPGVMAKLNDLLQQSGVATLKEEPTVPTEPAKDKPADPPAKLMSAQPDVLAILGAEVMAKLGVKSVEEARGKLQALQDNSTTLMSATKTETKLLLLTGLQESRISPDEVAKYSAESPEFVTALLANRVPRVNTKPAAGQQKTDAASSAGVDQAFVGGVDAMLLRTTGVKL